MHVLAALQERFRPALEGLCEDPTVFLGMIKVSQNPKFGDYQANFAMPLSAQCGKPAREVAAEVVALLRIDDICEPPEIAGPGFINLRLKTEWIAQQLAAIRHDDRLGVPVVREPRHIVIDFSSPNVAKPMHVGHLRSTVIGHALYRLLKHLGHHVTSDNHVGDWGTQFGMIIYGYKHFLNPAEFERAPVAELSRLYRLVNQLSEYHDLAQRLPALSAEPDVIKGKIAELEKQPAPSKKDEAAARKKELAALHSAFKEATEAVESATAKIARVASSPELTRLAAAHPEIAVKAREETAKLHHGDAENVGLWQRFIPVCLDAMQSIYDRFGLKFDLTLGESHFNPFLADVVRDLKERGLAVESDGAQCVFLRGFEAPFIVQKRDQAYTYATTDLATIRHRVETMGADVLLYVVDARQGDHFKMLFETARLWGYQAVSLHHVSFGTVMGLDGRPYKTREGDAVGLESLLDEAVAHAREVVEQNCREEPGAEPLDDAAIQTIADVVGIGAVKYADLSQNRENDYVFSYEKMMATRGNTATYCQYAVARVAGYFRKGKLDRDAIAGDAGAIDLSHPAERALAVQLLRYADALQAAATDYRPNLVTQFLFETADAFTAFNENCPVLKAENDSLKQSRLRLADLTARVLSQGLALLGIATLDRM